MKPREQSHDSQLGSHMMPNLFWGLMTKGGH